MPLIIDQLALFPGDGGGEKEIRAALEAAAPACADGVTWKVSIYEGPDLDGTQVVLEGPRLSQIETEWWEEQPGRYVTIVVRDGEWIRALCNSVARVIRRAS